MLKKHEVLSAVVDSGVVLIVRLDSPDAALAVSRAAVAGGIRALEITLSVPRALEVVRTLADEVGDHVAVGVGTVLDAEMAVASVQAGARMLVSPNLNPDMIRAANRYQALTISGAFTPTEIVQTMEAGADIVKLFPTEIAGPDYLRTVMAPLAHAPILPAGGATRENVGDWFAAGALAVGVGSAITKAARASGDIDDVTRAAADFLAAVESARTTS
ncbi:bifunctional 4-hydroxy-2-oxoglutarate aldolase/2-dehydro-3-deoxy-phosphogluconate aldolase [Microbacterium testaceum]|uniref:bifunctional 4-hydroxy-2-oxoglutarate aldolase/2-dehydro-3-deoxy-phosphogluconate aldolase n=1 Tax=Microbacterium testaceum TaxID=2033 RepID=UPI002AC4A1F0|nr:bifunctional 4-hydroxy-2-oxoglutarate aldolase/2-dehydro-3-deoxy-phosphogluconate aldolase [Microbacterium testaceum]MDZ5144275.1 bifunctional 4-hydroxy-2-oxoglutarate aldolase/2-dehydro-3-deoxy-phosphogluconate aldolase [Microbacterium testaceum]